ncbi:hypothetical protein D3C77_510160 [compost metagenome]
MAVRAKGVGRERHRGQGLVGAQHPHAVAVDQGPAVQGGYSADRSIDVATRGAGALAVVGHDEPIAEAFAAVADPVECGLGPAWLLDRRPAPGVEVEEAGGRYVLAPVQLEHQRRFAAGQDQEQPHAMLRHAQIGAVHDMRGYLVTQRLHCR